MEQQFVLAAQTRYRPIFDRLNISRNANLNFTMTSDGLSLVQTNPVKRFLHQS